MQLADGAAEVAPRQCGDLAAPQIGVGDDPWPAARGGPPPAPQPPPMLMPARSPPCPCGCGVHPPSRQRAPAMRTCLLTAGGGISTLHYITYIERFMLVKRKGGSRTHGKGAAYPNEIGRASCRERV